jgi:hypothetical protein
VHIPTQLETLVPRLPAQVVAIKASDRSPYAHDVKLHNANLYQYRALLDIVEPSPALWEALLAYEPLLHGYKLSYAELAFDVPCDSMEEAREVTRFLGRHLRKKYHRRLDVINFKETRYWEQRKSTSNLVVYARRGKRDRRPLAHVEFRFRGAEQVKRKLGITTLRDFISFDPIPFFRRHVILEAINFERLGRWLLGLRPPTPGDEDEDFQRHLARKKGRRYCRRRNLNSAAALRAHLLKQRQRFKNPTRALTTREVQFRHLTSYMIDTFFTPLVLRIRRPK